MVGIDVGAAEGLQPHWWAYEGAVQMYLFEPHDESAKRLREICGRSPYRDTFRVVPAALASSTGQRPFYMLNAPTGSSLFPIDPGSEFVGTENHYVYPIRTTSVAVRRTAEALDELGIERVDIAKLDVQGAELDVLQGFDDARARALTLVEVEINVVGGINSTLSPYVGAPTWTQIDQHLTVNGLRLLDIAVSRRHRDRNGDTDWYQREVFGTYESSPTLSAMAWEVDAVYVRDFRGLIQERDGAGLRRLIVALGAYRFFSEAHYIVDQAGATGVFDAAAAADLRGAIVAWYRLVGHRPWHGRGAFWSTWRKLLSRSGLSQLRRWKQYMWFDYPNG